MPKNPSPCKQPHQDSEELSQESALQRSKRHEPLNLSPEQLQSRLHSLKDYATYHRTKNQRVNLAAISCSDQAPIVSTALDYGSREGRNEVLPEYIRTEQMLEAVSVNRFEALIGIGKREKRLPHSSEPSFIKYKTIDQKERCRLISLGNARPKQHRERYIADANASQVNASQKITRFPKELKKLKNRLSLLPVLRKQSHLLPDQHPQPEQNRTLSINESLSNETNFITDHLQPPANTNNNEKQASGNRNGREDYLKEMREILHKSKTESEAIAEEEFHDSIGLSKRGALKGVSHVQGGRKRSKRVQYWPNYPEYSLPKKYQTKIQKLRQRFSAFNPESTALAPQLHHLQQSIKQQIQSQQSKLNKQLVASQQNMLGHKFEYLFQLEQQNYKRNMRELIRCKKEYTLEKRREEIRANGIRRMKKVGLLGHRPAQPSIPAEKQDR